MNKYEITFITKEESKDSPLKKEVEALGGKIISSSNLGQKTFAYKIRKETAGFYSVVLFEMAPDKVMELSKKLSLNPEFLRHIIIVGKAIKIEKPKKEPKEVTPMVTSPRIEKPATEAPKIEMKPVTKKPAAKPEKKKTVEKEMNADERLEALDKKLDELLKE